MQMQAEGLDIGDSKKSRLKKSVDVMQ